eukprot:2726796-Rhodomonas_salina.1
MIILPCRLALSEGVCRVVSRPDTLCRYTFSPNPGKRVRGVFSVCGVGVQVQRELLLDAQCKHEGVTSVSFPSR